MHPPPLADVSAKNETFIDIVSFIYFIAFYIVEIILGKHTEKSC